MKPPGKIYISYRAGGTKLATRIYDQLLKDSYRVFTVHEELQLGPFHDDLLKEIDSSTDVVVVLEPRSLDSCVNEGDWMRREIARALQKNINVIPVQGQGVSFQGLTLPDDINKLREKQGVHIWDEHEADGVKRLEDKLVGGPSPRSKSPGKIFISFHTEGGHDLAIRIRDALRWRGYDVFLSEEKEMPPGDYPPKLLQEIKSATDVIVVLTPNCLDQRWVRWEIEHAVANNRPIIHARHPKFTFLGVSLPRHIDGFPFRQGPTVRKDYFPESIKKLERFLVGGRKRLYARLLLMWSGIITVIGGLITAAVLVMPFLSQRPGAPTVAVGPGPTNITTIVSNPTNGTGHNIANSGTNGGGSVNIVTYPSATNSIEGLAALAAMDLAQTDRQEVLAMNLPHDQEFGSLLDSMESEWSDGRTAMDNGNWQVASTHFSKVQELATTLKKLAAGRQYSSTNPSQTSYSANGIVGEWKFNETNGTTSYDSSGYGNNGVLSGGVSRVSAATPGLIFPGEPGNMVHVPTSPSLSMTDSLTIFVAVNLVTNGPWQTIVGKPVAEGANPYPFYDYSLIAVDSQGGWNARLSVSTGGNYENVDSTTPVSYGSWHQLIGIYDGHSLSLYVDGALAGTEAVTGAIQTSGQALRMGCNGAGGDSMAGKLGRVMIYDRTLSASEVKLFTAQAAPPQLGAPQIEADGGTSVIPPPSLHVLSPASVPNNETLPPPTVPPTAPDVGGQGINGATSAPGPATVQNSPPDTTPPTVSITSPTSGTLVSNTVMLSATAAVKADGPGMASVTFLVDGMAVNTDINAPYSCAWNSASVANGVHMISVRAQDAAGNQATSTSVTVTVQNPPPDTTPPVVQPPSALHVIDQ